MIIKIICNIFLGLFVMSATLLMFMFLLAIFVGMWEHLNEEERKVKKIKER